MDICINRVGNNSCQQGGELVVEPINKEANEAFLSGKNLDARLYSPKVVFQYYQVSGYRQLSQNDLGVKLDSFVNRRYPLLENSHRKSLTIWFYRKQSFGGYDDLVYQSARERENGSFSGHSADVVALVDLTFPDGAERKVIKHLFIYYPAGAKPIVKSDTVMLR